MVSNLINIYKKDEVISPSKCDNTSKLAISEIFKMFMDLTAEHAKMLGYGREEMEDHGLFWIITKIKIKIYDRPMMFDNVVITTWPEKPNTLRCNRYSSISENGETLIEGKTEWIMMEKESYRFHKVSEPYPMNMVHLEDKVCEEPFIKVNKEDFDECDKAIEYVVKSTDIDFIQHMNNVAYIKNVLDVFTCQELEELSIKNIEVCYREQCFEKEKLIFKVKNENNLVKIGMFKENNNLAFYAVIYS